MTMQLCPAQQWAFDGVGMGLSAGNIFVVSGDTGMGKTTVLSQRRPASPAPT
jgi:ABC-type transport system involved in cytochrome c biogenesis ATPase subunit